MTLSAIVLINCPDQKGLVYSVTEFIAKNNGNIISLDEHVDPEEKVFFMRVEWDLATFKIPRAQIQSTFQSQLADRFKMDWSLYFSDERPRAAIFVSTLSHCLYDILARCQAGEWHIEIPLIVSNHKELEAVAKKFGVPFHHLPVTKENKAAQEKKALDLLKKNKINFVVLARYMQILSPQFISAYRNKIINIHHSFLPAFPGAKPYHSAYKRGVKIIGVTSHYVTSELDAGPIIEQDVVGVTHKDSADDMVRLGRDLEKVVLARAIFHHLQRKILVYKNRTIVFI